MTNDTGIAIALKQYAKLTKTSKKHISLMPRLFFIIRWATSTGTSTNMGSEQRGALSPSPTSASPRQDSWVD